MKLIHCADIHLDSRMETHLTSEQACSVGIYKEYRDYQVIYSYDRVCGKKWRPCRNNCRRYV